MLRTIWGDDERYVQTYLSKWANDVYFPGDGAKRDEKGYFWLLGRVDDVMNVAGHRIGTMEVESALVDHDAVAEAAVVGISDELKGTAIAAFVILKEKEAAASDHDLHEELRRHVAKKIGAIAKPDKLFFVGDLPKTRSGKIMRRLLRDIAEGRVLGDTTTLADSGSGRVVEGPVRGNGRLTRGWKRTGGIDCPRNRRRAGRAARKRVVGRGERLQSIDVETTR